MVFHANEFLIDMPEIFKDKSVNVFALTDETPSETSIVVTRNALKPGEDLASYISQQITQLAKQLPKFQLAQKRDMEIGEHEPAVFLDYRWETNTAILHQWQVTLTVPRPSSPDRIALTFTLTCKDQISSEWGTSFAQMLRTLRLRYAEAS